MFSDLNPYKSPINPHPGPGLGVYQSPINPCSGLEGSGFTLTHALKHGDIASSDCKSQLAFYSFGLGGGGGAHCQCSVHCKIIFIALCIIIIPVLAIQHI